MKNVSGVLQFIKKSLPPNKRNKNRYIPSAFLRTVYNTEEDFNKIEKLFNTAQKLLFGVTFNENKFNSKSMLVAAMSLNHATIDFNKTSELMKTAINESDMRECGKIFLNNFTDT